jgi:2-polyprenyl-6-methoxyphenol hydroxylase-like FAD-dependent oxidoreductase
MDTDRSRIIILGAGPVGLGAALELARFGVPSVVIEKHAGTSFHPKTRNFCTRTMEIVRGWGRPVYERLRAIDTPPGWKTPIRFLTSAVGEEYGSIDSNGFEGPGPDISPALPIMSSQERIEEIMADAARASGLVELRFNTRALRLIEGGADDAARAVLEVETEGGAREEIEGAAIVGADGAQSLLREELGVELQGSKGLICLVNCYFRADIEAHLGDRTGVLFFVANQAASGVLQPLDAHGRWLCQISVAEADWSADVFTRERATEWVRGAAGIPDLDVEMLSIGFWKLNATVAEHFVQGRAILVGDAAHQFPPSGGIGVNTGLQGMHNAMWKLAMFVNGAADWGLVRTYHDERHGVATRVTAQSLQNSVNVGRIQAARMGGGETGLTPAQIAHESRRYGNHLGVEFGASYASRAIVPDGAEPPQVADDYSDYVQSGVPGCRAPHVWLGSDEATFSSLDLLGGHFVLLAGPDGEAWCEQAEAAAKALGIRIGAYRIGAPGLQDRGSFLPTYGLTAEGAVLIRPDGYVAWRSAGAPSGGEPVKYALSKILGRT